MFNSIRSFSIELDNIDANYMPGDQINGSVDFSLTRSMDIKTVKVLFNGSSNVHWEEEDHNSSNKNVNHRQTESHNSESSARRSSNQNNLPPKKAMVSYDANEIWFSSSLLLLNNSASNDTLNSGHFSYKFQFILPKNIPASFYHKIGSISYSIEACIEHQIGEFEKFKRGVTVNQLVDLNHDPLLKLAYGVTEKKEFCCDILLCSKEPVIADFTVDKSGYIPGQDIKFNIKIDNKSKRAINTISVYLYKTLIFQAQDKKKNIKVEIASIKIAHIVEPRSIKNFENKKLKIPNDCKATMNISKIIKTQYELILRFGAGGLTTVKDCNIPIFIGTIPFHEIYQEETSSYQAYGFLSTDGPPTYDEATKLIPSAPPSEYDY